MKVVFMGSPDFALPALRSLILNKYDIDAVYTQPDKKTGRGQHIMSCPVKEFAAENNLKVMQPVTFKDASEISLLKDLQPDMIVVAAYGQILPDAVLQIPKYRCLNIHPSLLPKYRGPSPVSEAVLNGDEMTGVTVMLIEKKVDSGPILSQKAVPIYKYDTTGSLSDRLAEEGAELLIRTIPNWVEGKITPIIQDEQLASYTKMVGKEDGKLDWNLPAVQLERSVRAYYPWPGSFTLWKGSRLRIIEAIPLEGKADGDTGLVVALSHSDTVVGIKTADGILGLLKIQPESKREMSPAEFIAGHRDFVGSVLT